MGARQMKDNRPDRQGRILCPPKDNNTFEGLEEVAKLVDAKGCYFHRGTSHPKEEAIQDFLDSHEEEDFPFGEVTSAQFLVAPPVESSGCGDSDCDDEHDATNGQSIANLETIRESCAKMVEELPKSFRENIRSDAESLATLYTRLCPKVPWLTIKLEFCQENYCGRWHQDYYVARSIVTYVGPGTCAAEDNKVKWDEFAKTTSDESNDSVVPEKDVVQMPTNSVLLMKGDSWPGIRGKGLTHKSPTDFEGNDAPPKRLILKVDLHNSRPLLASDDDPALEDDSDDDGDEEEQSIEQDTETNDSGEILSTKRARDSENGTQTKSRKQRKS